MIRLVGWLVTIYEWNDIEQPVLKEFHKLHGFITATKNSAEKFARNWFSLLPSDILYLLFSFLPFQELGRMASVSKKFNGIINKDERFWKSLCLDWWDDQLEFKPFQTMYNLDLTVEYTHPLSWTQEKLLFNPIFNWKWFAKCAKRYQSLGWKLEGRGKHDHQTALSFGTLEDGQLEDWWEIFL